MEDQTPGTWLVWGAGASVDVRADALGGLPSALAGVLAGMEPVTPADDPAVPSGDAAPTSDGDGVPDCGEGDLSDDLGEGRTHIALIREHDPRWTPPAPRVRRAPPHGRRSSATRPGGRSRHWWRSAARAEDASASAKLDV